MTLSIQANSDLLIITSPYLHYYSQQLVTCYSHTHTGNNFTPLTFQTFLRNNGSVPVQFCTQWPVFLQLLVIFYHQHHFPNALEQPTRRTHLPSFHTVFSTLCHLAETSNGNLSHPSSCQQNNFRQMATIIVFIYLF